MKLVSINSIPYAVFKDFEDHGDYFVGNGSVFYKSPSNIFEVSEVSDDYTLPVVPREPEELTERVIASNKRFNEEQRKKRAEAFAAEADPLFFASARGEEEQAAWLAKVEEIRERFPYKPTGEGE